MRPLMVPEQTAGRVTAGPASLCLGAAQACRRLGGSRRDQASAPGGLAGVGFGEHMLVAVAAAVSRPERRPSQAQGPRTQPAAVCDREIEDALGTRGHREGRQRCGALTTSARTCPRRGELAQPGAGHSRDGLSPSLSPPLCGPEDWAPQCRVASLGGAELTEGPPGPGWKGLEVVGPEQGGECWACRALSSVPRMRVRQSGQGHISSGRQQPAPASLPALGPPCGGQPEPVSHLFPPGHLHTPCVLNQRPCEGRKNFSPSFWPTQGPGG